MEPVEATAESIVKLNEKIQEACTMGRPDDAMKYSDALQSTASAYNDIKRADD